MAAPDTRPVCSIGAGSSGVTAAKALKEQGVAFEGFELGSQIGGMWRHESDNGLASAHVGWARYTLGVDFRGYAQQLRGDMAAR